MEIVIEKVSNGYIVEFFADIFKHENGPASAVSRSIDKQVFPSIDDALRFVKNSLSKESLP